MYVLKASSLLRIIGSYLCLGRTGLFCECDPFPLGKSFVLKTWEAEVSSLLEREEDG